MEHELKFPKSIKKHKSRPLSNDSITPATPPPTPAQTPPTTVAEFRQIPAEDDQQPSASNATGFREGNQPVDGKCPCKKDEPKWRTRKKKPEKPKQPLVMVPLKLEDGKCEYVKLPIYKLQKHPPKTRVGLMKFKEIKGALAEENKLESINLPVWSTQDSDIAFDSTQVPSRFDVPPLGLLERNNHERRSSQVHTYFATKPSSRRHTPASANRDLI